MEESWTWFLGYFGGGKTPLHKPDPYILYRWGFLHFRYLKCSSDSRPAKFFWRTSFLKHPRDDPGRYRIQRTFIFTYLRCAFIISIPKFAKTYPRLFLSCILSAKTICHLFSLWFCFLTNPPSPPKKKTQKNTHLVFFNRPFFSARVVQQRPTLPPQEPQPASSISMNLNMTPKSTKVKSAIPRSSSWTLLRTRSVFLWKLTWCCVCWSGMEGCFWTRAPKNKQAWVRKERGTNTWWQMFGWFFHGC